MIFITLLFCFLFEDTCKDAAKKNPNCIRDYAEESHIRRCTEAAVGNAAEHIAVVPGYYKTHDVGEN